MKNTCLIIVLTITCTLTSINTWAKDNAVILLYHHVSDTTPKVTSVSPATFRQHLAYLAQEYTVLPLKQVIVALQTNQALPDKTVAITFDDGYDNIYHNAHPILKEFAFPYTVFINPPLIGNKHYQLNWQQIEQMTKEGASFANHGNEHNHMLLKNHKESEQGWLDRSMQGINQAESALTEKLGYSLKYYAYPYGEFDAKLKARLKAEGYIGFAQHSGAIASYSDFSALPRYPAAGIYGRLQTLKVKLNSLAMPVDNVSPDDPKINLPSYSQALTFSVKTTDVRPQQINCFQKGQALHKSLEGEMIKVDIMPIIQPGRHRVNCTAPSIKEQTRFYWFSQPFFMPTKEGEWLD